ncbi:MAG: ferrous iron transporter B [Bacteriovoracaceae bacterium]|jgi:ferrous iron transport protein B|nr:ferrous iron transporter B [Bacteriovoracaceae bacterium]
MRGEAKYFTPLVALAGTPNCGKSSLFNILTGKNQRTGNFPGITVEKKMGDVKWANSLYRLIDLPGTYSLDTRTLDEKVAKDVLFGLDKNVAKPHLIVVVVDSTNLGKSLYLPLEIKKLGIPMIVALNLYDLATERGQVIDIAKFERELGIPVVTSVATNKNGAKELSLKIEKMLESLTDLNASVDPNTIKVFRDMSFINKTFKEVDDILESSVQSKIKPDNITQRIDRWALHPVIGPTFLVFAFLIMFQAIFSWSGPLMDVVDSAVGMLSQYASGALGKGLLGSFVVDGIIGGVGNVIIFLPQILILFLFVLILEDVGYMGRAAFILDNIMRRLGLPGKAVVPLLSSHACAIPGIMAARTLADDKDRLTTMMIAPLTQCSARLPVFALLIGAFFAADTTLWGVLNLSGLIMFGLYMVGIVSAFIMAAVFKRTVLSGSPSHLLMELPPYRLPDIKQVLKGLWNRAKIFIKRAGTIILALSMLIWVLVSFPKDQNGETQIGESYAATVGKAIEPIFRPLGFDWRITTALIPSFGAREIVVSSLGTVLSIEGDPDSDEFSSSLGTKISKTFSVATLLSLLVWFIFAPQCVSTFAIMRRETGGWKWPAVMGLYTLALAYFFSFITYQIMA